MVTIGAKIVRGLGAASRTLQLQMPEFLKVCPELEKCSLRTINVILECHLEVLSTHHLVGPVDWTGSGRAGELFGLRKVRFETCDGRLTDAWIYIPYGSPHRLNPFYAEILAPPIDLGSTPDCKIHLSGALKVLA
jgi:hypothetical protein